MQLAPNNRKWKRHRPDDISEGLAFSWQQQHIHIFLWDTDSAQSPFTVCTGKSKQSALNEFVCK